MNYAIFLFFYNLAHLSPVSDSVVIFFAVYFPYIVVILAGMFLLFHHDVFKAENPYQIFLQKKKELLMTFFCGAAAWVMAYLLKISFQISRPFDMWQNITSLVPEAGYGFPSGHATFYMALAFSLYFTHKKAGYMFILFAVLIGIARIVAGVHSPFDILGGFILGAIVAFSVKNV